MSENYRHFVAYSGIKLPFKFVNEITDENLNLRNTYFKAYYDDSGRVVHCQKIVYGEVEFEHKYEYFHTGILKRAEIIESESDDVRVIEYNEQGMAV